MFHWLLILPSHRLASLFSKDEEKGLVDHVTYMAKTGYGYSRPGFLNLANEYAIVLGKKTVNDQLSRVLGMTTLRGDGRRFTWFSSLYHLLLGPNFRVVVFLKNWFSVQNDITFWHHHPLLLCHRNWSDTSRIMCKQAVNQNHLWLRQNAQRQTEMGSGQLLPRLSRP